MAGSRSVRTRQGKRGASSVTNISIITSRSLACRFLTIRWLQHMDVLWQELTSGFSDSRHLAQVIIRLLAATVFGALVGYERQRAGKPAGLRTHTLVCLGTTVFILACSSAYMTLEALSRAIQGIVTGIGFIGAGSILKLRQERDMRGLTTAA